jgi:cell division protein FtsB
MIGSKQNIIVSLVILAMFSLLLFTVFGEKGLADLSLMKKGRDDLKEKNAVLFQENLSLYRAVYRLKHDINFVEYSARQELGMIGKNEYILKTIPKQDNPLKITEKYPKEQ